MDIKKLLDFQYLFEPYANEGLSVIFLITLLAFFVLGLVWGIWAGFKREAVAGIYKKGWRKWQIWGWSNGLVGLLLLAFRQTNAIYLGSRIWLLLWLIGSGIWLIMNIVYQFRSLPNKAKELQKNEEFNKWLPRGNQK